MIGLRNRKGWGRFICASRAVLPFGYPSYSNLSPQESFDHPKCGYVRDSWKDVFSSCEGSVKKLLAGYLLRDDSRLVLHYDRIVHELGFGP